MMIFIAPSSLATSLSRWETAEYVACAFVAIACLGEYIADFTNWLTRGIEERKKRLAKISTLLLIFSLAFELVCLVRTNIISGQMIGSLSDEATTADTKAQSALDKSNLAETEASAVKGIADASKKDAKDALTLAARADADAVATLQKAEKAEATAGKAEENANGAHKTVEDTNRQLALAQNQLNAVEAKRAALEASLVSMAFCTAPRILPVEMIKVAGKSGTSVDSLRPFNGRKATIEYVPFDGETLRAAMEIARALKAAEWTVEAAPKNGIRDGVLVQYPSRQPMGRAEDLEPLERAARFSEDSAIAIVELLQSYGWEATLEEGFEEKRLPVSPDTMRIEVGLYPLAELLTPLGLKAFKELGAEFRDSAAKQEAEFKPYEDRAKQTQEMMRRQTEEFLKFLGPGAVAQHRSEDERLSKLFALHFNSRLYPCKPLPVPSSP